MAVLALAVFQPWTYLMRAVIALVVLVTKSGAYCAVFGIGIMCGAVALPLLMVRTFALACAGRFAMADCRCLSYRRASACYYRQSCVSADGACAKN